MVQFKVMAVQRVLPVLLAMSIVGQLGAQAFKPASKIPFKRSKVGLKALPFNKIRILDARYDTSCYWFENMTWPRSAFNLQGGTIKAVNDYFLEAIKVLPNYEGEIICKVNLLRVPNRHFIQRRDGPAPWGIGRFAHESLYSNIEVYMKTAGGLYREIVELRDTRWISKYIDFIPGAVQSVLNVLLQSVDQAVQKNDSMVRIESIFLSTGRSSKRVAWSRSLEYSLVELEKMTRQERWESILDQIVPKLQDGYFNTFDDFVQGRGVADSMVSLSRIDDSVVRFRTNRGSFDSLKVIPWAVQYSGKFYYWLYDDVFIELKRSGSELTFVLPSRSLNIYSIFCYEYMNSSRSIAQGVNFGNGYIGMAAVAAKLALRAGADANKKFETSLQSRAQFAFARGVIDLDNGDCYY